jgi:hypothetical protein
MDNHPQNREYKKLLIISHNALSDTKSNGKVLTSLFCTWPRDKITQLYFWNEWPDTTICDKFYRVRDHDVLKANLSGKSAVGVELDARVPGFEVPETEVAKKRGILSALIYEVFSKRMPLAELVRDIMWRKSVYLSKQLVQWLDDYEPEMVLLQGSHMSFAYKMTLWICERYGARLQIILSDNYTFVNNRLSPFAWINHVRYIKWFKKGLIKSSASYAVVPAMKKEYEDKFKCGNICVASNCLEVRQYDDDEVVSEPVLQLLYAGNVGINRWRTLCKLGECLAELNNEGYSAKLRIYTPTPVTQKIKEALTVENVMTYEGSLTPVELIEEIKRSNVLVHVESFDRRNRRLTRLSLSTKIPESMMSGRCLLAIGPNDISSIEYLKENQAAIVICNKNVEQWKQQILQMFNVEYRRETARIAHDLARKSHDVENIRELIILNSHK